MALHQIPQDATSSILQRTVSTSRQIGYDISWHSSVLDLATDLGSYLGERGCLVVTTPTVASTYGDEFLGEMRSMGAQVEELCLPLTESIKTMEQVALICEESLRLGLGRQSTLLALGGGVCSDVVTVAAQMIRRGIDLVRVPTTLLAQVDAGVGIKGAVHFNSQKNFLGCFYPPRRVLIAPAFLGTLEQRQLRSGMAEIAKVAIVGDAALFAMLEESGKQFVSEPRGLESSRGLAMMARSIHGLLDALEPNLFEDKTRRRSMDFGHTFSPGIESASNFSILHGEAVAIDMALSVCLALELGWVASEDADRMLNLIEGLGLERDWPALSPEFFQLCIESSTQHRGGNLNLFLPTGIGTCRCLVDGAPLTPGLLGRALVRLRGQ